MTVHSAWQQAQEKLKGISDAPRLDAERILLHVLNKEESSFLHAHSEQELTSEQQEEFEKLVNERATGKPLAYILGEWEFYGRMFYVTPDVLVPRPETEELVTQTLELLRCTTLRNMVLVDIGTGSGVIAITLALEFANFQILATDISKDALRVAKKNAERHGVLGRIEFIQEDMAETLQRRDIDLIVSNPPYVPSRDVFALPDPAIALDGGKDGQMYVRKIARCGSPAIVESTNGVIRTFGLQRLQP